MARSKRSDAEQSSNIRRLDRGTLRTVTEWGIRFLTLGKFRDYAKNETIAITLSSLDDRIRLLEDLQDEDGSGT